MNLPVSEYEQLTFQWCADSIEPKETEFLLMSLTDLKILKKKILFLQFTMQKNYSGSPASDSILHFIVYQSQKLYY